MTPAILRAFFAGILVSNVVHAAEKVDFNRDIRPIISDKCFACHGPDAKQVKGKLRLDLRENAIKINKDGLAPIFPGDVDKSLLVSRIFTEDADDLMPPAESKKTLSDAERAKLKQWIAEGAEYKQHWSFITATRPKAPSVKDESWVTNEVDKFILAALQGRGMKPSAEASRNTLVRRISLDLRGLPPTTEEVDAFIIDDKPGAYERMVDRMFASQHYGEKMALLWMDLARYGDTNGYHYDSTRQVWLWREWVINAYNQNMPFDQFTQEQLAGDLIPEATIDQKIASGFNRNTRYNEEGGSDPDEFRVRYAVDRTNVLGQVWLGLTVGCAECHSHKYDPISHKEFYQLYAFFNSFDEPGSQGHNQKYPPHIEVPQKEQGEAIAAAEKEIVRLQNEISQKASAIEYKEPDDKPAEEMHKEPVEFVWVDDDMPGGVKSEGNTLEWVETPVHSGSRSMKRVSEGNQQHFFTNSPYKLKVGEGDKLFAWIWIDPEAKPKSIMLQYNTTGTPAGWLHRGFWGEDLIPFGAVNTTQKRPMGPLPETGKWMRLELDAAHIGLTPGMEIHGMAFTQFDGTAYWDTAGIVSKIKQGPSDHIWFDDEAPEGAKADGGWTWVTKEKNHQVHSGTQATRRQGKGLTQHFCHGAKKTLKINHDDVLYEYVWLDPEDSPKAIQMQFNDGNWNHRAYWGEDLCFGKGEKGPHNYYMGPLPKPGKWARLEVSVKLVGLNPGAQLNGWAFTQFDGTVYYDTAGVKTWLGPDPRYKRSMLAWEKLAANDQAVTEDVRKAIAVGADKRTDEQKATIQNYYVGFVFGETRGTFDPLINQIKTEQKTMEDAKMNTPFQLVTVEMATRRPAFVLMRGNFLTPGEEVKPDVPAMFKPFPKDKPLNRLGLAQWLTDPEHPLVSRVTVNRFWSQLFGFGIVQSMGDFGMQGTFPTHPDLLDWLATDFVESGWDVKALLKKIVMSSTYRQASHNDHRYAESDPENKLLWRAPRFRLMAEEIRDSALLISGLLNPTVGGRPVNPYQPAGYYQGKFNWQWPESTGDDLYRRGMYTFWRRTTPYPTFLIFDAQDRSECVVERPRTNTPLQALTTLNDPQFVEAARVYGQKLVLEGPKETDARLTYAFKRTFARPPEAAELAELKKLYDEEKEYYKNDLKAAEALVKAGKFARPTDIDVIEHATWTALTNVLLNLDEFVMRE
ncbi:MAG: PSD1 and planctomycete cytochrome C domain-containing protein [Planctomycetota bacterium]|nr:PSD1 and planctomycete cytochrome C domain-containing protein [Planctomycetota bacterium]